MSELLNSGQFGTTDKSVNSNKHIYDRWENYGFLEGLDIDLGMKVALSYELAAGILLMDRKLFDMYYENTGKIIDYNERVETIVFPILRRIIAKTEVAHKYVPEIVNMVKKEYNTSLCKSLYDENEKAIVHLYNNVLPKWSEYHRTREYKNYDDMKKADYNKHVDRSYSVNATPIDFEGFKPNIDWEAEYAAAIAEKIERDIIYKIKDEKDGTN